MNTLQLNAEFLRDLSIIAEDEALSAKLMKYIKKLVTPKTDPTLMTKEEFFAGIEEAEQQIERGEGRSFTDKNAMNAWLNSL